jgi:transposase
MDHDVAASAEENTTRMTLWMALELSLAKWKLGFSDGSGRPTRVVTIEARDYEAVVAQIERAKRAFGLTEACEVRSLYEAGREGFSVHRRLDQLGVHNVIVDPASLEVSRHARRAKSDSIDVESLLRHLVAYGSNRTRLAIVRVPSPEDEARRQLDRELESLKKERGVHKKRIQSLLFAQGIAVDITPKLLSTLDSLRTADGRALPIELVTRIRREGDRLGSVERQIREAEKERHARITEGTDEAAVRMRALMGLCGIGWTASFRLVVEFFGWRTFANRRQVAQAAGLASTPYASGTMDRDQGISKVGNRRVRALMIELAWMWLRWQPESDLAKWYARRFGDHRRARRIGIVAVARRLLIDLWRFVSLGVVPSGARLKPKPIAIATPG